MVINSTKYTKELTVMKYIIYKITNNVNNKIYIGAHKTNDIDDGYMGSGKYLIRSQLKHGIENFSKEVLFEFDNSFDMYAKEAELVDQTFVSRSDTYNLKVGGEGGFDYINNHLDQSHKLASKFTAPASIAFSEKYKNDVDFRQKHNIILENARSCLPEGYKPPSFKGKTHTAKTKKQISDAMKLKGNGVKNSQYGSCWIYSLQEQKCIKVQKMQLADWLSRGWIKGRKMKF